MTEIRIGDDEPTRGLTPDEVFAAPSAEERAHGSVSALDGLRAALQSDAVEALEPVTLKVPRRPGVSLAFMPAIEDDDRKAWLRRSTKKSRRSAGNDEVDELQFAGLVLANTCVEVRFDGEAAVDGEGTPLTFRHKMLWDMLGAHEPLTAIRALFASDAHVLVASNDVLLSAGYDDDLTSEDPTQA